MRKRHPLNDSLFSRDNGTPPSPPSNILPVFNPATNPTYGQTSPSEKNISALPDSVIVQAYSAITGYSNAGGFSVNDTGVASLDALNYFRKSGIGGHKILAFTGIGYKNIEHVKLAIYLFGGIYAGLALPVTAKTQDIWDVPAGGAKGNGARNSWGGHAVACHKYDKNYIYCITWGAEKKMTWNFFTTYCEEAYVLISEEFIGKKSPNGFDMATLQKDLKAIAKGAPQVLK